jgi:ADP-ribose pyrophosphatase
MDYKVTISKQQNCFKGFFTLDKLTLTHSLFAGGVSKPLQRELIHRGDAVAMLLYDPNADALVIIEQFRVGAVNDANGAWVYELVAGFQEQGESIEDVIQRELQEETGLESCRFEFISTYYSNPANSSDRVTLVCAQVDSSLAGGIHGVESESEDIRVHVFEYQQIGHFLSTGRLSSATPIIAIQWLQLNHERLRSEWSAQ